jgi:hypothetical protein
VNRREERAGALGRLLAFSAAVVRPGDDRPLDVADALRRDARGRRDRSRSLDER